MKFMIIRKADPQTEASVMPGQQLLMDMGRYNEALSERLENQPRNLGPYLHFNGQCAQAFRYYAEVLGGSVDFMMTFGDSPEPADVGDDWQGKIMHAHLTLGNQYLMGCDAPECWYQKPQGFSVQLQVSSAEQAERVFTELAEGGIVRMPMAETFWARRFGAVVDRFDIPWMINYPGDVEVPMPAIKGAATEKAK